MRSVLEGLEVEPSEDLRPHVTTEASTSFAIEKQMQISLSWSSGALRTGQKQVEVYGKLGPGSLSLLSNTITETWLQEDPCEEG